MKNVVFLDTVHPVLWDRLTEFGLKCIDAKNLDKKECKELLCNAFGVVIRSRFRVDETLLKDAKELKFIARSGSGLENIDIPYCEKKNIVVFNSPEGNRNAVGEHVLGLLLNLLNKISKSDKEIRSKKWNREGNRGEELDGKTIGIIGYGNNGKAFAKKLKGFEVDILAYDKYKSNFSDNFVKEANLSEIYNKADVISFHIPLNKETKYWANDAFFNQLKKPIYLLNISRGEIIKTTSLLNAIEKEKIKGAGLDVLEFEPSSFAPFLKSIPIEIYKRLVDSEKIILTPHVAGWTKESYFKLSNVLANKIISHFSL